MAYRNAGRNAGRGRQPYRNSFRGGRRSFYTLDPVQDLPKGDLIKEIALGQIEPGEKPTDSTIMIGDVGTVASYNWLDAEKPTILVPGLCRLNCFWLAVTANVSKAVLLSGTLQKNAMI